MRAIAWRTLAVLVVASFAASAHAQSVRYSRPYAGAHRPSAYFDHRGGAGCTDWACGGTCYDTHSGNDFAMPVGTPVLAAAAGRVVSTHNGCANYGYRGNTCGGRCGNYVSIQHADGSRSTYCHMQLGSLRVSVGQNVSCGQQIGASASSGSSTGPHLHFGHRSPGASASSDPFAGSCSRATSLWAGQGPYRGNPEVRCASSCTPSGETCNGRDDDCDGRVDEGLRRGCGSDVGECRAGTQTCSAGSWGACQGAVGPRAESCDGRDQDCDGRVDEGLRRGCGSDVGECRAGTQTCSGGGWGACQGSIGPRAESCDGRDEDCDGRTDEDLRRSCGTDVGECVAGIETCARGAWGECAGAVLPVPEVCDALDNDCDGEADDERICEREEVAWGGALHASDTDTDVDGDGRADACARTSGGFSCLVAGAHGFPRVIAGAPLEGDDFWTTSQIRMGDVDGDGRADVCGREGDALVCWGSSGSSFDRALRGPSVAGATTIELADVSGDGRLDACVRSAAGLACHSGSASGFGAPVLVLPALGDEGGFADVVHHGSIRFGDVDGDGRADVCARGAEGVDCWRSEGERFGARVRGPRWSDAEGWAALSRWSTLRLGDVDGDGRADLCARGAERFRCALSGEHGFAREVLGPAMGAAYERADVYSTLRLGDVDGDGRADVCAREPAGIRCWLSDGRAFDRVVLGPALDDASGWTEPARYRSIRLADVDGDGRADLCARHEDGLRCSLSTGRGFERTWLAPAWSDAESGLADARRATSIRVAGSAHASGSDPGAIHGWFSCRASGSRGGQGGAGVLVGLALALALRRARRRAR